jgi:hypothetical protein
VALALQGALTGTLVCGPVYGAIAGATLGIASYYAVDAIVHNESSDLSANNSTDSSSPDNVPDFDFNDPTKPPTGQDGEEWEWRGKPPAGGGKGGWKNPNGPESIHPDLDHSAPIGPHWDFNDRKEPGWRIDPNGKPTSK